MTLIPTDNTFFKKDFIVDRNLNLKGIEILFDRDNCKKLSFSEYIQELKIEKYYYALKKYIVLHNLLNKEIFINYSYNIDDLDLMLSILPKGNIIIEITENFIPNKELPEIVKKIKKYNFKVAIDDFGSNYSNFLRIFGNLEKIDYLKIDGNLIKNFYNDIVKMEILDFLTKKIKLKNIQVIAEYIENKKIFDRVKNYNFDYYQGYYINKVIEEKFKN